MWKDHRCYGYTTIRAFRSGAFVKVDTTSEWYLYNFYLDNKQKNHGRLEIRTFQEMRNFVSPRGHVISSIYPPCGW